MKYACNSMSVPQKHYYVEEVKGDIKFTLCGLFYKKLQKKAKLICSDWKKISGYLDPIADMGNGRSF